MEYELEQIKVWDTSDIPEKYTGIVTSLATKNIMYFKEGKLHREGGPALENIDGGKHWFINGDHHRTDGPAIEYPSGYLEWWVDDFLHAKIEPRDESVDFYFDLPSCVFLESWIGDYGLKWFKILTEDEVVELPLIFGMKFSQQQLDFFIKNKVLDGSEVNHFMYAPKT